MKKLLFSLMILVVCAAGRVQGQNDAAVAAAVARQEAEENFKRLQAKVDDLTERMDVQEKRLNGRIQELTREVATLRDQANKPRPVYVTPEELNRLKEAIVEVDRKRVQDGERLSSEFRGKLEEVLNKLLAVSAAKATPPPQPIHREEAPPEPPANPKGDETFFEYKIKARDNFITIAKAYQAKGFKVTSEQIATANPGVKSEKLIVGHKIWIPLPASAGAEGNK